MHPLPDSLDAWFSDCNCPHCESSNAITAKYKGFRLVLSADWRLTIDGVDYTAEFGNAPDPLGAALGRLDTQQDEPLRRMGLFRQRNGWVRLKVRTNRRVKVPSGREHWPVRS